MSKFIDKLKQVSEGTPQTIGFRRAEPVSTRWKILLVASLTEGDINSLDDYVGGADAGVVPISRSSSDAETIKKIAGAMADIPWGGWLGDIDQKRLKQVMGHGCDFVVFPADSTPLTIAQGEEVGKILQVEATLDANLLRAVNELPVDAVLVGSEEKGERSLTWYKLMLFQRFADLLTKPLLVSVPPNVTAGEIKSLWEAGVDGVVVEAGGERPAGELEKLRKMIDKMTFQIPRRREKRDVLLPRTGGESGAVAEAEEEEEE